MISIQNVTFHYPDGPDVLQGANLEIQDGEFVAIMGENGAGKTTLVKMFNGLLKPDKGTITVDGIDTRKKSVAQLSRDVGLIFQNPDNQLFAETVSHELAFSLRNFGFSEDVIEKRVTSVLNTLDLERYEKSSPFVLSGGERKRVALAAILVWDPKHVIMDEPTIGQDYLQKDRLRNFIMQLVSQGKTVVIVTHDVEFVAECKPRVVLLSHGKVIGDGSATAILTNSSLVQQASLVLPQISTLMKNLSDLGAPSDIIDAYSAKDFVVSRMREKVEARTGPLKS
ncbi:MAG TPA: ABC transporter ATP-binding protein [Candidatus Acidoferrales bacterium]|nr:ABC transporter ATP-binding protein [Candidatus Acidoferrales bacterium]